MNIFDKTSAELLDKGYTFERTDFERPWGGFFVIEESHKARFIKEFFSNLHQNIDVHLKISPKILLVAPGKRLSWQYHHRRSELWQVVQGTVAVVKSMTDQENEPKVYERGDQIELKKGERHRLIGLDDWGIVAEIWIHTDRENPSTESDIVRIQDDFNRS